MNDSRTLECALRSGGSEASCHAAHVHHTRAARARVNGCNAPPQTQSSQRQRTQCGMCP